MFIFNYSNENLEVAKAGHKQTLPANELVYVDEGWVTLNELKAMFGNYIDEADKGTAIEEFLFDEQFIPEVDTLYICQNAGTGIPRLFVKGGAVKVLCSDSEKVPTTKADLVAYTSTDVTELLIFESLTKYMAFEVSSGTPEIVLSNVRCHKSKTLTA